MKRFINFVILFTLFLSQGVFAQESAEITQPQLELKINTIEISYDILNSSRRDLFDIWVEVTDTAGNLIEAKSLSGDVGEDVKGGSHRKIFWDLSADNILLDAGIYIQVYGERLTPMESEIIAAVVNPYRAVGQSLIFPGWGLTASGKSKLHLTKGIAGYGFIAAAIVYNQKGVSSYEHYLNTEDMTEVDDLFNEAVSQDNLSEAFAYTAIGIWAADLIWTYFVVAKINNEQKRKHANQLRIQPSYDQGFQSPMLALQYRF